MTSIQVDNIIDKKLNIVNSFGNIGYDTNKEEEDRKEDLEKKKSFKVIDLNDEPTDYNMEEFSLKDNETNDDNLIILNPIVLYNNIGFK